MSASQQHARGWADLPRDVLLHIFRDATELPPVRQGMWGHEEVGEPLVLADLFCAASVCSAWHKALASPTIATLAIGGVSPGKRGWMLKAQPGACYLRIHASAAKPQAQALLRSLNGMAVHDIEVARAPRCLLDPSLFPNLHTLRINSLDFDAAWLYQLGQLPLLDELDVCLGAPVQGSMPKDEPLALPSLPELRSLTVFIEPGTQPLLLNLGRLPAVEEIKLFGRDYDERDGDEQARGEARLVAGSQPSRLRKLSLDLSKAWLDFSAMPALQEASIWASEVHSGASLAAATSLVNLRLGSTQHPSFTTTFELALDKPWVEDALRAAPPSLHVLRLHGSWLSPAAAAAVSGMRAVQALSADLEYEDEFDEEVMEGVEKGILGPGPLWHGLQALRWGSREPLPQALSTARQLHTLDIVGANNDAGAQDLLDVLIPLRGNLRRLLVATRGQPPSELEAQLRQGLPQLERLVVGSMMASRNEAAFLKAASAIEGA